MNLRDYTFEDYGRLLDAAIGSGYEFLTVAEFLRTPDPDEPFAVIRHDVDRKVETARSMAALEADRGVASTYYFRTSTFEPEIVEEMADLGHEIGYHYETLASTRGDVDRARTEFAETLGRFRETAEIETACAHGSPLSSHGNLDMWDDDCTPEEFGLLGEAYLSIDSDHEDDSKLTYLSDTGRSWRTELPGYGRIETTDDLADTFRAGACPRAYLLVHPCRWARNRREWVERAAWDVAAETAKSVARTTHGLVERAT